MKKIIITERIKDILNTIFVMLISLIILLTVLGMLIIYATTPTVIT